jgi:lipoate-protein ligase A
LSTWRLIKIQTHNAFMNMAIDEAILTARIENRVPNTLRLYRWKASAVSIGKFQKVGNEIRVENCRKYGVNIVRRITGGGAVYHESDNEITYSAVFRKEDFETEDISAIYAKIYAGLSEAVEILGAKSDFNEGNTKACPNLTISGRKMSGSAQCHKQGVVLQHGTVLVKVNLERMFSYLRVPWAETTAEVVNVAKNKITSIEAELGEEISHDRIQQALVEGFQRKLKADFEIDNLTCYESNLARRLCGSKYSTDRWNLTGQANGE